jgi:hypothetical protein
VNKELELELEIFCSETLAEMIWGWPLNGRKEQ